MKLKKLKFYVSLVASQFKHWFQACFYKTIKNGQNYLPLDEHQFKMLVMTY